MKEESWKVYNNSHYEVSNLGNVRSLKTNKKLKCYYEILKND